MPFCYDHQWSPVSENVLIWKAKRFFGVNVCMARGAMWKPGNGFFEVKLFRWTKAFDHRGKKQNLSQFLIAAVIKCMWVKWTKHAWGFNWKTLQSKGFGWTFSVIIIWLNSSGILVFQKIPKSILKLHRFLQTPSNQKVEQPLISHFQAGKWFS